jgi:hypothetical protein
MFVTGVLATVTLVIGVVLLLTGLMGWCPLYSLFGIVAGFIRCYYEVAIALPSGAPMHPAP